MIFVKPEELPDFFGVLIPNEKAPGEYYFSVMMARKDVFVPLAGCYKNTRTGVFTFVHHVETEHGLLVLIDNKIITEETIEIGKNLWEHYYDDEF